MHFNLLQIVDKTTSDIKITFLLFSFITAQISALATLSLFERFPPMKKNISGQLNHPQTKQNLFVMKSFLNLPNLHLGVYKNYQNSHPLIFSGTYVCTGWEQICPPGPNLGANRVRYCKSGKGRLKNSHHFRFLHPSWISQNSKYVVFKRLMANGLQIDISSEVIESMIDANLFRMCPLRFQITQKIAQWTFKYLLSLNLKSSLAICQTHQKLDL